MIAALISVYYPSESVKDHVKAIASQVDRVYICDNSPESNAALFAWADLGDKIQYTCFRKNLGLSRAFNRILRDPEISWQEDDAVFFFDQDSLIEEGHIEKMLAVSARLRAGGWDVGCLGPVYFNTSSGTVEVPKAKKRLFDSTYAVSSIITSSMLCTYGNLRRIGFWNEHVFLDMADWDLCWRMMAAGKICCMTQAVILHHSVGSGERFVGPLKLRVGQPIREYYQIRECMYLFSRAYTPVKYRVRFLAMLLVRSPLHLLFLDQRKLRLRYMIRGFADFCRGKQGAMDTERSQQTLAV